MQDQHQIAAITAGNKHLISRAVQPTGNIHIAGDGLTQRGIAHYRRVGHVVGPQRPRRFPGKQQPLFSGERVQRRNAKPHSARRVTQIEKLIQRRVFTGGCHVGPRGGNNQIRIDQGAFRSPAYQVAFAHQHRISRLDGFTGDMKLLSQHANRRKFVARLYYPGKNVLAIAFINFPIPHCHVLPLFNVYDPFGYVISL